MGVPTDTDNDSAVTCTDCEWLGYAADANEEDDELVCPDCNSALRIA